MDNKLINPPWLVVPTTVALMVAGAAFNVYAATAAGTEIKNLATVSYEDAQGNSYTAQSNEAVVTVAQVFSATINSTDTALSASAGQPVDISYTLVNTGNGTDTYEISAADGYSGGDQLDADNITIYEDVNNNGQADSGEPFITDLVLASDEIRSIVVRVNVPTNAVDGDGLGITLTAVAQEGTGVAVAGSVTDITAGKGPDATDGTVESLVTITSDAVIVTNMSSIHDVANKEITYTVTIKNNGNSDATDVKLRDAIPENTTYLADSVTSSGLLGTNADTVADAISLNEGSDSFDYNADGDTADSLNGIGAADATLPPNATVSVTYTVSYDPATVPGGTVISNNAFIVADVDDDAGTADVTLSTNQVNDTVGDTLLVAIADTAENTGGDGINDGQDDDAANDIQLVDQVSAGDAVVFKNVLTNNGNTSDVLELSAANVSFPAGTVFTFWNEAQTVQLADSNGEQGVDTGVMASGASKIITVVAQLPSGFSGTGDFDAIVTVTSRTDPTISETVTERLSLINASTIDIHNAVGGVANVDDNPIGAPDYSAVNVISTDANTTVSFPLFIDNDDDAGNAYQLNAGSIYDSVADTVSGLPTGWSVEFFLPDVLGEPTGNPITTTPVIPGKTLDFAIVAVVTIPADKTKAVDDFVLDNDADGTDETLDANSDGDGDYPIFFQISSANTGASDVTLEAIDVNSLVSASFTPNGSTQIDPGGSETYLNTLINTGNATETYSIDYDNSQIGWSSALLVDTDGDGVADMVFENLAAGVIQVRQPDGTTVDIEVALVGGLPEFTLDAGEALPVSATVFSPANAPNGEVGVLTISAENIDTNVVTTAQNQSEVVSGKVRIEKTAALDNECDGIANTTFTTSKPETVEPGQCVIWKIVAENRGTDTALNVQVRDAAPSFTTYVPGSMSYCLNQSCTLASVSDIAGDDEGEESAGDVVFYIGNLSDPAVQLGGELVSGNEATVQFSVSVD